MRRGVVRGGILFFRLFPPARAPGRFSAPQPGCVYVLLTIKGTHRFTRAFIIISAAFPRLYGITSIPRLRKSLSLLRCSFPPPFQLYARLLLSRILSPYDPDKCNFLFTNLRSALDSKLSSCLASTYLFISRLQSSRVASHLAASFLA